MVLQIMELSEVIVYLRRLHLAAAVSAARLQTLVTVVLAAEQVGKTLQQAREQQTKAETAAQVLMTVLVRQAVAAVAVQTQQEQPVQLPLPVTVEQV
jgi:chorismate mutase